MIAFNRLFERKLVFVVAMVTFQCIAASAQAALVFYYDPDTGNVAMDTRQTSSGSIIQYYFFINDFGTGIRFRPENHIRLTQSTAYASHDWTLQEVTFGQNGSGLFTIGDVLPLGLSESLWSTLFTGTSQAGSGYHAYTAELGTAQRQAEFVYGPPEGEFDNRWDYVDPDTLTWAQSAKLIYRQWSGEVVLDTTGLNSGYVAGYHLRSDDHFLPDNHTPPGGSLVTSSASHTISLLAGAVEPGKHSLGEILEAGLSHAELESLLTVAKFFGRTGFGSADLDLETEGLAFSLVFEAVPEPSTSLIAVMASSVLLTRRRSHRLA